MKLCKQIWNERKHNSWLWLELFVVSVILWYVVDMLYVSFVCYNEPRGHHIDHTYTIDFQHIDSSCDTYVDVQNGGMSDGKAILEIMSRLRQHPDIEAVCLSQCATPYGSGNSTNWFNCKGFGGMFYIQKVTPDFMKVFRCEGLHGETSEDLANILQKKQVLFTTNSCPDSLKNENFAGATMTYNYDKENHLVGGTMAIYKRTDYSCPSNGTLFVPFTEEEVLDEYQGEGWIDFNLRVKDNCSDDFAQRLFADAEHYQVGNLLMIDVQSMEDVRTNFQANASNRLRQQLAIIIFLLLNIFFGVLGTFWFRTQQRRHEIALLRAIGSSQTHIYKRMIYEGIVILIVGSLCAWIVDYIIANAHLNQSFYGETLSLGRFLFTTGCTLLCMIIMVVIGIMIPARKAQQIEISTALHDE